MLQPTSPKPPQGLLPKGSRLQGDLLVAQGLRIEGDVQGHIRACESTSATVVVAEEATVLGAIEAPHVVVFGQVQGPIVASESLQVHAGAQIEGDVRYRYLDLHPQAVMRGVLSPILGLPVDGPTPVDESSASLAPSAEEQSPDLEAANGPNADEGKPETILSSGEDAVPSGPKPA